MRVMLPVHQTPHAEGVSGGTAVGVTVVRPRLQTTAWRRDWRSCGDCCSTAWRRASRRRNRVAFRWPPRPSTARPPANEENGYGLLYKCPMNLAVLGTAVLAPLILARQIQLC